MDERTLADILARLSAIESRLDRTERRLANLDGTAQDRAVKAADIWRPATWDVKPPVQAAPQPAPTSSVEAPARPVVDTEYRIGAQVLPKVGATIFILGLAYLVSLAVGRGYLTPTMLWWGVNALCLGFVAVGQWKREAREDFGQILTGIGSCGLYLNFAAGHIYQKLYEGEMLVGLFVVLSLINLAYALWRSSRSFLVIGLLGGLIAALMPLDERNFQMNVLLHFLILVPASLIAARNRWIDMTWLLFGAGLTFILPIAVETAPRAELRVGAILATGLVTIAAHVWSYRPTSFDKQALFGPCALFLTGLIAFLCVRNVPGAITIVGYGAAIGALAFLLARGKETQPGLLIAAVMIPAILSPFGFLTLPARDALGWTPWIFLGIATLFALASRAKGLQALAIGAGVELALGLVVYLARLSDIGLPWQTETAFVSASLAVLALVSWSLVEAKGDAEQVVLGASLVSVPLIMRLSMAVLMEPTGASMSLSTASGLLVAGSGLVLMTRLSRWESSAWLAWTIYLLGFFALTTAALTGSMRPGTEWMMLSAYMAVLVMTGVESARSGIGTREPIGTVVAAFGGLLVTRFIYLILIQAYPDLNPSIAVVTSVAIVGLLGSLAVRISKLKGVATITSIFLAIAIAIYIYVAAERQIAWGQDVVSVASLMLACIGLALASYRLATEKSLLIYGTSLVIWGLFSRLGYLLLTSSAIGMKVNAAVTFTWILIAVIYLVSGFLLKLRDLRLMSFGVIAATVCKVLLVDLSALDPGIRVAILLVLGLAMIGGGYLYIRRPSTELTPP